MDPIVEYLMKSLGKTREQAEELLKQYKAAKVTTQEQAKRDEAYKSRNDLDFMAKMYGDLLFKPDNWRTRLAASFGQGPIPLPIGNTLGSLAYPPRPAPQPVPGTIANWNNMGTARPLPNSPIPYAPGGTGGSDVADLGGQ